MTLTICSSKIWQGVIALFLLHDVHHHTDVVSKRSDTQPLDHHITQVIGVEHQVLSAVAKQFFIILLLILAHLLN